MDSNEKGKAGEDFVYELATNSFLSYWCYPNPFDEDGDKKEICDLLIHFHETLILCCVKNYEFKGLYERYFRKSIEKDVRQLYGAEKKITASINGIRIKNKDGREHILDPKNIKHVHRLIIHLGDNVHFYPFNRETKTEGFVHVFDKTSFQNLVRYLDTIRDFEEYLTKREAAFGEKDVLIMPSAEEDFTAETGKQFFEHQLGKPKERQAIIISGTESDVLAHYIENDRAFSDYVYSDEYTDMLLQLDGDWDRFLQETKVKNKQQEDHVSYFIDEFVRREILTNPTETGIEYAKELLSFSRFERRVIAKQFFKFVETYNDKSRIIARRYGEVNGIAIIFVFYSTDISQDQIDNMLPIIMDTYTVHTNYKYSKQILIAVTTDFDQFKFGCLTGIAPYDKETEADIRHNIRELKYFTNITEIPFNEKEFPEDRKT